MPADWHEPGDLTDRINKRFDEIYATGDEEAMRRLDVEVLRIFQAWLHKLVRTSKANDDLERAAHIKHVAHLLQREAVHAREEHE